MREAPLKTVVSTGEFLQRNPWICGQFFRAEKACVAVFFAYYRAFPHAVAVLVPVFNRTPPSPQFTQITSILDNARILLVNPS